MKPGTVTVTFEVTISFPLPNLKPDDPAQTAVIEGMVKNQVSAELERLNTGGPVPGMSNVSLRVRVDTPNPVLEPEKYDEAEYAEILSCNAVPDHPGLIDGTSAVLLHEVEA